MSTTREARKESGFLRYLKGLIRVMARARDYYVQSITRCGDQVGCSHMGYPTPLPSFSTNSSYSNHSSSSRDDDLRELIRAASTRNLNGKIVEAGLLHSKASSPQTVLPCSSTVAIGRIDEDKPCEFGADCDVVIGERLRSKSAYICSFNKEVKRNGPCEFVEIGNTSQIGKNIFQGPAS